MSDPLLTLVDGSVLNLREDHWTSAGCPTCDYGKSYVRDFTVETTRGNLRFKFDNPNGYGVSEQFLMQLFLQHTQTIQALTVDELYAWLTERFREVNSEFTARRQPA